MKGIFYRCARMLVRIYMLIFLPIKAEGMEKIPDEGAVILCGNHISLIDPVAIAVIATRPVHFMAKKELFRVKLFAFVLKALNAFPVDRKNSDMAAMRTAMAILKNGDVLGIFPEGGREKDGIIPKMETGVGMLAMRAKAAVVPVRIVGPYRLFRRTRIFFGDAIELGDLYARKDAGALPEIMQRIESGVYGLGTQC